MDKGIDSRKTKSHRSHDKKMEYISVYRHHNHSPRHSIKREESIPSLSHVRKHKRRSGVDDLEGEMNKIKPPTFDSEHK
jgi:hypothetical protein